MQRDLHFLERTVERLDRADVEFAMRLWQEPATVRMLLHALRLPETVERVALGMGIGDDGPWLVVTRDGQFVTCLGEGMSTGQCHVVPATKFASVLARVQHQLAEADAANARVPQERALDFLRRLHRFGPWLSREDFRVYAAWQPALVSHYAKAFGKQYELLIKAVEVLGRARQRPVRIVEPALRVHWEAFHGVQTLMTLLALDGRLREMAPLLCHRDALYLPATGEFLALMRTAWVASRFGKTVVPDLKQVWREDTHATRRFAAALALMTIAVRHRSVRAEVGKILAATPERDPSEDLMSPATRRDWVAQTLENPAVARNLFLEIGRKFVVQIGQSRGGLLNQRWPTEDSVPDEVAGPMLTRSTGTVHTNKTMFVAALVAPAWLAEVDAADLYLPEAAMALLREPTRFDDTLELFERLHPTAAHGPVPHRTQKVGRNDPCPCRSGRKVKKCCGESAAPRTVHGEM